MTTGIGEIAYNEYREATLDIDPTDWNNHLPEWDRLDEHDQVAWQHAALAVAHYLDEEREAMAKEQMRPIEDLLAKLNSKVDTVLERAYPLMTSEEIHAMINDED
jgi:hypothetical protein